MSHDGKYQFHMGCGEPLCSQWCSRKLGLGVVAGRATTTGVRAKPEGERADQRCRRKK